MVPVMTSLVLKVTAVVETDVTKTLTFAELTIVESAVTAEMTGADGNVDVKVYVPVEAAVMVIVPFSKIMSTLPLSDVTGRRLTNG